MSDEMDEREWNPEDGPVLPPAEQPLGMEAPTLSHDPGTGGWVEVWRSESDRLWYLHLKGRNGEVVLPSQGYTRKQSAYEIAEVLARRMEATLIVHD